jgi:SWI/SNF-related matrix-associated actin-dependent regulator of chromatin subfamily A-like protein 1
MELFVADRGTGIRVYAEDGTSIPMDACDKFQCGKKYKPVPAPVLKTIRYRPPEQAEIVLPKGLEHLKEYQVEGIKDAIRHGGRRIIADEMGLGKTLQAIGVALYYRATDWPVLVICPSSVKQHWAREFKSVGVDSVGVIDTVATDPGETDVVIMSYGIATQIDPFGFKCIIVDESHYVKNMSSKRTKCVVKACIRANRVILLSGTPLNRPADLFTQFRCISDDFTAFHGHGFPKKDTFYFADRYCAPKEVFIRGGKVWRFEGKNHLEELSLVSKRFMIRRFKRDVLTLPEIERERLTLYEREDPLPEVPETDPLTDTKFMEAVRETCVAKVPHVVQYVKDVLKPSLESDPELKMILFAHHRVMMDALTELFHPKEYIRIDGSTNNRMALVDRYQTDPETRVAILSITATGVGLTLTAGSLGIFTELVFGPDQTSQAEARLHRIGQRNTVTVRYLVAGNSTDDVVWSILQNKTCVAGQVLENRKRFIQFDQVDATGEKKPRLH